MSNHLKITSFNPQEKRQNFLNSIELNGLIGGLDRTRCKDCSSAIFQAKQMPYQEEDYVIPSVRTTPRQRSTAYWLICTATGKHLSLGDVSACEAFEPLDSTS